MIFHYLLETMLNPVADEAVQRGPRYDSHQYSVLRSHYGSKTGTNRTSGEEGSFKRDAPMPYTPGMQMFRRILAAAVACLLSLSGALDAQTHNAHAVAHQAGPLADRIGTILA